jgi:hypothetical protein
VLAARIEFLGEAGGEPRGVFGLGFRGRGRGAYLATVAAGGGAELWRVSSYWNPFGRCWSYDPIASSDGFRPPAGPLYLVAMVRGKRVELFCNGELALAYDELPEEAGAVGFEVRRGAVLIHDVKWRPLPSDPRYRALYGEGRK